MRGAGSDAASHAALTAQLNGHPDQVHPFKDHAVSQQSDLPEPRSNRRTLKTQGDLSRSHVSPTLVVADAIAVAGAASLGCALGVRIPAAVLVGAVAFAALSGLPQRTTLALSVLEQIPWLVRRMATAYLLASPLLLFGEADLAPVALAVSVTIAVVFCRGLANVFLRRRRDRGRGLERTLVVGLGRGTHHFVEHIASNPRYGMEVVGFIGDQPDDVDPDQAEPDESSRMIGQLSDLPTLAEALGVRRVIVGPEVAGGPEQAVALRAAQAAGARVHLLARMAEVAPPAEPPYEELVLGLPITELPPAVPGGPQWWLKRAIDLAVASILLLVLSPVMGVIAIAVRRSSPGPVLFRQTRVGRNGSSFVMFKFRTFPVEHRDIVQSLRHNDCPLRVGRFLRRSSLDELPQLLNVLRGEMSLIGPRPERPQFAEPLSRQLPDYADRHRVRGGMTGLAQTMGLVGDTSIEDRVRLDNRYIDGWSLWQDMIIVARTMAAIARKAR